MKNNHFSQLEIILNETSHPGNIGAVARAMKIMDMTKLTLVKPRQFPDTVAYARSSGATDLLDNATVTPTLDKALAPSQVIFATSARSRSIPLKTHTPKEAAPIINSYLEQGTKVAILFGNEQHGLSNEDLLKCNHQIIIPTSEIYSSLNLGAAVQIICYEIFCSSKMATKLETEFGEVANSEQIEQLYDHLMATLSKIDYLEDERSSKIAYKIKAMIQQYNFKTPEVKILRGVLTQINKKIRNYDTT